MRRKDREVTDPARIREIISRCDCCRLGLRDGEEVYIVPLSFGYEEAGGERYFYFHGAAEGRKLQILRENPRAGFELDTGYVLRPAEAACGFSASYESIIGTGRVELLLGEEERAQALNCIMAHSTGRADWSFAPASLARTAVLRLRVEQLSCKVHE